MTKLIQALIARILTAQTETEWNTLCRDIDICFQQERITSRNFFNFLIENY